MTSQSSGRRWLRKRRIVAFSVIAFVWPFADDAPANLDAILNQFRGGHGFMELLLKVLMIAFMYLAVREAASASPAPLWKRVVIWSLVGLTFVLANLDDFALVVSPLHFLREAELWDPANASTKIASVAVFYAALRVRMPNGRNASSN
jgi:hypothetical protein